MHHLAKVTTFTLVAIGFTLSTLPVMAHEYPNNLANSATSSDANSVGFYDHSVTESELIDQANTGDWWAQAELARRYYYGIGVARHEQRAFIWSRLALKGQATALKKIQEESKSELTKNEIKQARRFIKRFPNVTMGAINSQTAPILSQSEPTYTVDSQTQPSIRWIQHRLNTLGFQVGPVDGVLGRQTRGALRDYQETVGLRANGLLTQETISALTQSTTLPSTTLPSTTLPSTTLPSTTLPSTALPSNIGSNQSNTADNTNDTDDTVQQHTRRPYVSIYLVQHALVRLGYDIFALDGVARRSTVNAISDFQQNEDLPITGFVSNTLLAALTEVLRQRTFRNNSTASNRYHDGRNRTTTSTQQPPQVTVSNDFDLMYTDEQWFNLTQELAEATDSFDESLANHSAAAAQPSSDNRFDGTGYRYPDGSRYLNTEPNFSELGTANDTSNDTGYQHGQQERIDALRRDHRKQLQQLRDQHARALDRMKNNDD